MSKPKPLAKRRNGQAFQLVHAIMADRALSSSAKCVAVVLLLQFQNAKTGKCNPSFAAIAMRIGRNRRATFDAVRELKEAGWVSITGTGGGSSKSTNQYVFKTPPPQGQPVQEAAPLAVQKSARVRKNVRGVQDTAHEPLKNHSSAYAEERGGACTPARAPDGAALVIYDEAEAAFGQFWTAHPRPIRRIETRREFCRIVEAGLASPDDLIDGARRYAADRDGQNGDLTLGSLKWLQTERWTDGPRQQANGQPYRSASSKPSLASIALLDGSFVDQGDGR
jgi:hypothetical protein